MLDGGNQIHHFIRSLWELFDSILLRFRNRKLSRFRFWFQQNQVTIPVPVKSYISYGSGPATLQTRSWVKCKFDVLYMVLVNIIFSSKNQVR